ncbi:MAG TPA: phosphoribosylanthranilate isomerase [Candidatus Eisenbacteria bacterium]|nr:phosphoribosylanthranilate isomerase [Candidatus Eisenbacteria bacterium]
MKTRIKICGIVTPEDAAAVAAAGADYLGLVFTESPRRVTLEQARAIRDAVPNADLVGVFRDETPETVAPIVEAFGLRAVQVEGWLDRVPWAPADVWHVLRGATLPEPSTLPMIPLRTYLLDAYDPSQPGGTGKTADLDWARIAVRDGIRFFLAGGLNPANVGAIVRDVRPYGVDVSTGLQLAGAAPGRKDLAKVRAFVEQVRQADHDRPKRS